MFTTTIVLMITRRLLLVAALVGCTPQSTFGTTEDQSANVRLAVSMAATRLGIEPAAVNVMTEEYVTWRNSSLGCPRPDMFYTQILIPGYRIELEIAGRIHSYHGRVGGDPVFCAKPGKSVRGQIEDC